jgi:arabinofuranosyltransferase
MTVEHGEVLETRSGSVDEGGSRDALRGHRREPGVGQATQPVDLGVLAVALVTFTACVWRVAHFITDDAYISLRYARNLAEGHGPVFNPGGPPTEGFSNPLMVFMEAAVYRLFGGGGPAFAQGIGIASGLALVVAVWYLGRPVLGRYGANAAAVLVAASPAIVFWTVGGLETLPFLLLCVVASLLLARADGGSPVVVGVLLALLPWLRIEGIGLAAGLVFFSEIGTLVRGPRREALRRLVWLAGLPLLSQLLLQVLRWVWFGHLLPNPVIYKTGAHDIGVVTAKFLAETAPIAALAIVGVLLVRGRGRLLAVIPAIYAVASLTFADSVNGFSRLVLPALPLMIMFAVAALPGGMTRTFGDRPPRWVALAVATGALAGYVLVVGPVSMRHVTASADGYMECRDSARREAGEWFAANTPQDTLLAIGDAGLVPYLARRTVHDLFNLNEASIQETGPLDPLVRAERAHALEPDFFVLASSQPDEFDHRYWTDQQVTAVDAFDAYELATVTGSGGDGCWYYLHVFERTG